METNSTLGVIKWYANENGYGIIEEVNTGKEIFLHFTNWNDRQSIKTLTDSNVLVFESTYERSKLSAKRCRFFDNSIEDYALFYGMTIRFNEALYVKGKYNRIKYISELLKNHHKIGINNFSNILATNIEIIENNQYLKQIQKLTNLFSILIDKKVIYEESLKRFKNTQSATFKKNLLNADLIDLNDIKLSFVLANLDINDNLLDKIVNHPELRKKFDNIISKVSNLNDKKKLILLAIINSFENVDKYIKQFMNSIESQDFIEIMTSIKSKLEAENVDYNLQSQIQEFLFTKNDKNLNFKAHKKGFITISEIELIENYIAFIDKNEFLKIEESVNDQVSIIEKILFQGNNQELIQYIIINFEKFTIDNYQIFLDFGLHRLAELNEENQVLYLKKLFHIRAEKKLSFSALDLSPFISIALLKKSFENKNQIDFSTFLIIDLISKFSTNGGFLATKELIKSVLHILQFDKKRKVQIDKYFDKCDGYAREVIPFKEEQIVKESFVTSQGGKNYYFKISFPYNETYVEDIKRISGSKYSSDYQFWAVPLSSESEVLSFARKHDFIVDLQDGRKYEYNQHLIHIAKNEKEKPIGYSFCCGQEAQKLSLTGSKFWWCNQNPCFQNNIKRHDNWRDYTLYDFMKILNFNLQETNGEGLTFENGLYTRFVTLLNRFNRLLEKLYCDECEDVLYPYESSNYHAHSVTQFICKNKKCSQ